MAPQNILFRASAPTYSYPPPLLPQSYTIGGTVSGLATGNSLVLADNRSDSLTVNGNVTFLFAAKIN